MLFVKNIPVLIEQQPVLVLKDILGIHSWRVDQNVLKIMIVLETGYAGIKSVSIPVQDCVVSMLFALFPITFQGVIVSKVTRVTHQYLVTEVSLPFLWLYVAKLYLCKQKKKFIFQLILNTFIFTKYFRILKVINNFSPNLVPEPVIEEPEPCDSSRCGLYSDFRDINGRCVCTCLPGYIGDPPNCRPECLVNSECQQNLACIDQKCQTPCRAGICGINAECNVINHNAICSCLSGYRGAPDAFTRCEISKDSFSFFLEF